MPRVSVGAITISDIKDGIHPISAVLSNQSHAFAADTAGNVDSTDRDSFSCNVLIYLGDTQLFVDNDGTPANRANETYRVDSAVASNGWTASITQSLGGVAQIKVTNIPTGTTVGVKSSTIPVVVDVKNKFGAVTTLTLDISLQKAIEGAGGAIVQLSPNRQTFRFDGEGNTSDSKITIGVATQGNVGALTAYKSINGGVWSALAVHATNASHAESVDIDGAGGNDAIVINKDNFGAAGVFAVKVEDGSGAVDTVSLIRIQDGVPGNAAISVIISSDVGGTTFRNNTGATKTLTCTVYDNADGSTIDPGGITYLWLRDGSTPLDTNDAPIPNTNQTIQVSKDDVDDGTDTQFTCQVTVA